MTTTTAPFELYDILIEQGIDKTRAKAAVDAFLTREEARHTLASKDDIRKLIMWIAVMMVGQLAANAAITFQIVQVLRG
ncbi:hypothetical protein [Loktanella sp. Alg231-35]|uniref:hypothetical protein n=1 Tax=Loktanella sp. Alg231-35 TaxID=1922220 RepID=UPI000D55F66E|nr:hypothetical protein [Loktanella sp. Alg231-35]